MTTRFILVRHGETLSSRERRFAGSTDVDLTDLGLEQASALAQRLRQVRIDAMFTSPLRRCVQTAEAVTSITGRKSDLTPDIRECHFGEWENLTLEEVMEGWADDFQRWVSDEQVPPPGGESWPQLGERVVRWFDAAAERYDGRTVLGVMHGGPIMWLARHVLQLPRETMSHFMIEPASVSVLQVNQGRIRVRAWNDTHHYTDPLHDARDLPLRGPVTTSAER